jgi:copper chaperone NosL
MATLHTENFIEFSVMKYIFGFFVFLFLVAALIGYKKFTYALFSVFLLFGILAMADFYRWNYNYGHHLDPNAAIKVPGMSYQPPLIGYKQLLNFGAYSIPDSGGILFIISGVLLLLVVLLERNVFARWMKRKSTALMILLGLGLLSFSSCGAHGPKAIKLHTDTCAYCKMTISNLQFATQLTTTKGRNYLFDDLSCMVAYQQEHDQVAYDHFYVADFCHPGDFIDIDNAFLLQSDSLRSPMAGNMAGFAVGDSMQFYKSRYGAREVSWVDLIQ